MIVWFSWVMLALIVLSACCLGVGARSRDDRGER